MIVDNELELLKKPKNEAENVIIGLPVGLVKPHLPAETAEELKDFILIGEEALKGYRAKVAGIKKLGLAEEVHQQTLQEAQRMGEAVLWAKAKLGELLKAIPPARLKGSSSKRTSLCSLPEGITKKISHSAQRIAEHQDLIPKVVAKSIENGDIPSRKDMEIAIREVEKETISTSQPSRNDTPEEFNPLYGKVISRMNPATIWLKDIGITMNGVENIFDIEIQWSYQERVFKIKQFNVVQPPPDEVKNAETLDGEGVREIAFSASQMESSTTEDNSKSGEDRLPRENLRIVFKAKDLKKSVSRCVNYTNSHGLIPEFGYLCFDGYSLTATDGTVGIIHPTPIDFGNKILVPAEIFYKTIKSLSEQEVEMTAGKDVILLKSGTFRAKFPRDVLDYFSFDVPTEGIKRVPKDFMTSIKQVRFSVGSDGNKPWMMGVYFDGEHFYSTDGYRITRVKSPEPTTDEFLIPSTLLKKVVGNRDKPSGFCVSQGRVWFFYDNMVAFASLPKEIFQNYKAKFEESNEAVTNKELKLVKFNRLTLNMALDRLPAIGLKPFDRINVVIRPRGIFLLATGKEGELIEEIGCDTDASGVFSVNLKFFKDAISVTECFYFPDQKKGEIYFLSQSGVEILLKPLSTEDDHIVLAKAKRFSREIDNHSNKRYGPASQKMDGVGRKGDDQ